MYHSASGLAMLTLFTLSSAAELKHHGVNCLKPGWFGKDCGYRCHCKLGQHVCDKATGKCDGPCTQGWFGPSCQYVISSLETNKSPPWLVDNDDQTCNDNSHHSVNVTLLTAHPFTWLRGILRQPVTGDHPYLSLRDEVSKLVQCDQLFSVGPDSKSFDITCASHLPVKRIDLEGKLILHMCSLLVSAGRDLSQKEKIRQVYNNRTERIVSNGITSSCSVCNQTAGKITPGKYSLALPSPVTLQRIMVHSSSCNRATGESDRGFELIIYNSKGGEIQFVNLVDSGPPGTKQSTPADQVAVRHVKRISLQRADSHAGTAVCKIEVLGEYECLPGLYGPQCAMTCNCSAIGRGCHLATGFCFRACAGSKCPKALQPTVADGPAYLLGSAVGLAVFILIVAGAVVVINQSTTEAVDRVSRPGVSSTQDNILEQSDPWPASPFMRHFVESNMSRDISPVTEPESFTNLQETPDNRQTLSPSRSSLPGSAMVKQGRDSSSQATVRHVLEGAENTLD